MTSLILKTHGVRNTFHHKVAFHLINSLLWLLASRPETDVGGRGVPIVCVTLVRSLCAAVYLVAFARAARAVPYLGKSHIHQQGLQPQQKRRRGVGKTGTCSDVCETSQL